MPPRVIFMGTPDFAVPALKCLANTNACEVALVVTQPDRRAGRGRKMVAPPVKIAADRLGLPVLQTATLRDPDVRQRIIGIEPDLIVVAAFGMILGRWILELPAQGCINLHASLLPHYRGANPIAAAIASGEGETGITLMKMDRGLDTGPIYTSTSLPILPDDTTESLTPRLADAAADLLATSLPDLLAGNIQSEPQGSGATLTRPMTKDDGWLDFSRSAGELECQVRAMWPWPRAWTTTPSGERLQIHRAELAPDLSADPGTIVHRDRELLIATGAGSLRIIRAQMPGGRPVDARALAGNGAFADGTLLGTIGGPEALAPLVLPVEP